MRRILERCLRRAAALALAVLVAAPDVALAADPPAPRASSRSLDSMSQSEIDALVSDINHQANWRMQRRPGDPPDFVPGKPVKVMHGAGAVLGRGGRGGRSFRQAGLSKRNGSNKRGNGRNQQSAMDRGRGSSSHSSSFGSSNGNGSSFGSSSRSSFGSGSSFGGSSFGGSSFGGSSFGSGSGLSNGM